VTPKKRKAAATVLAACAVAWAMIARADPYEYYVSWWFNASMSGIESTCSGWDPVTYNYCMNSEISYAASGAYGWGYYFGPNGGDPDQNWADTWNAVGDLLVDQLQYYPLC
jgi:hypothetical protein